MASIARLLLALALTALLASCAGGAANRSASPPAPSGGAPSGTSPAASTGGAASASEATTAASGTSASSSAPAASAPQAPAAGASISPLSPAVPVKVGTLNTVADGPLYVAVERGYFREEGLDVTFEQFGSTADMTAPLASGDLDVGSGAATVSVFNAVARGIPIKLVADRGQYTRGHSYAAVVIRKELSGQVRTLRDLEGRRVAIPSRFSTAEIQLDVGLKSVGLSTADVNVVVLPYPDQIAALANDAIDASVMLEPLITRAVSAGAGIRLMGVDEFYPDYQAAEILYGPVFYQNKAEAARRWMVPYLRGIRDFNAAFEQGQDRAAVVKILTEQTAVKDPALYDQMVMPRLQPDGYLNVKSIQTDLAWYVAHDLVKDPPSIRALVDYQYLDYAHARVGRLGPRQEVE